MLDVYQCRSVLLWGILAALPLYCGCAGGDSGPQRFDLSGSVSFDGKPVPYGRIDLLPDASKGNSGPAGFAEIRDGKFSTSQSGKGVLGGLYTVVLSGYSEEPEPQTLNDEELANNPPKDISLFQDYRVSVEFPKETTTHDFEVTSKSN